MLSNLCVYLQPQLCLQRINDVLHGGGRVVLERLGLPVLQEHLEHVGHQRHHRVGRCHLAVGATGTLENGKQLSHGTEVPKPWSEPRRYVRVESHVESKNLSKRYFCFRLSIVLFWDPNSCLNLLGDFWFSGTNFLIQV